MATHVCFIDIPREGTHRHHGSHASSNNSGSSSRLSPMSPALSSPRYERNMGFFQQLSRRFGLKSHDDLVYAAGEEDSHSSSTDSCPSPAGTLPPPMHASMTASTTSAAAAAAAAADALKLQQGSSSSEHLSCGSSDTSSTVDLNDELHTQPGSGSNSNSNSSSSRSRHNNANARKLSTASKASPSNRSSFTRLHRRSTSSIRRAFEGITLSTRSLSCSGGASPPSKAEGGGSCSGSPAKSTLKTTSTLELHRKARSSSFFSSSSSSSSSRSPSSPSTAKAKSQAPPLQRILRQPVSYTYLKGMSGLPTQRVPRTAVCCTYSRR